MTATYASPATPARVPQQPRAPRRRRGGSGGFHAGQVVAAQAAIALLVAASGAGYLAVGLAAVAAAALVILSWVRLRRRWLYQWLGVALRYSSRRHTLAPDSDGAALLDLLAPGARVETAEVAGDTAAVLTDGYGLTAVLEVGDPVGLLAEGGEPLPSPVNLLPATGPDTPRIQIQLVVSAVPAPVARAGAATSATSYRQLTEGRLPGQERVLLAVRVLRDEGWSEGDLCRALSSAVRKVRRRIGGTSTRPLGETAVLRTLADLAHHDGAQPAREAWQAVHLGGLLQTTFRLTRWPDPRAETARRLVARLLSLPAAATTISVTAGPREASAASPAAAGKGRDREVRGASATSPAVVGRGGRQNAASVAAGGQVGRAGAAGDDVPADFVVRVAALNPAAMSACVQSARRLFAMDGAGVRRLDGEHLEGLAATLPLGGADPSPIPGTAPRRPAHAGVAAALDLPVGAAGLMLGTNRHGSPVLARLFRAEPTRAMLVGGVRGAQLITLRAMALGARVVVQTARPQAWEPFVRGVSTPGETIAVIPPGRPVSAPPGTPLHPLLVVVDVGPVAADGLTGGGWQASLVVRDDLAAVDVDALARADLVVLQPLRPDEAALAGSTLGLGDAAGWLTRIRPDMVGVINRRAVRWALLAATPIEHQLIGPPGRT